MACRSGGAAAWYWPVSRIGQAGKQVLLAGARCVVAEGAEDLPAELGGCDPGSHLAGNHRGGGGFKQCVAGQPGVLGQA